jgi:hypothetical protein
MDTSSSDPGSTSGGGKPDVPNVGFVVQGNQRDLDSNWALSDFDRPHRFSGSFIWEIPGKGVLDDFRLSGFVQVQSGLPYSIFAGEPEINAANQATLVSQYNNVRLASGGLYRLGFGRPSLCGTIDELREAGDDSTQRAFNPAALCSPLTAAGGYPNNEGFGNLGRNSLRGLWQKRVDLSLSKSIPINGRAHVELRWDVFNVFNTPNFANPNNLLGDVVNGEYVNGFGTITDSVGGPRVMQFGVRLRY